jgi:TfoX/Sxy family transcriptional regulator of competence genes
MIIAFIYKDDTVMGKIDEGLLERVRDNLIDLATFADICERKMFGGHVFMVNGHMTCGVGSENLMLRVGADRYPEALQHPHTQTMDFTGRTMKGFLYVSPMGIESDEDLSFWLEMSLEFILAQPPK